MNAIKDQHILILGASSAIAKALAKAYAQRGYPLYLASRNEAEMKEMAADLSIRYNIPARGIRFDALEVAEHASFYHNLYPKPYGVICAPGYLGDPAKADTDWEEAEKIIHTNFTGCVSILSVAARHLEVDKAGFIIGISSIAGDRGRKKNTYYGAAKAGFSAYLSALRQRMFLSGVHVLTVKPGYVYAKMTEGMDLPKKLTATPEKAAKDIYKAQQKGQNVLYTLWFWRWIMFLINRVPEGMFKKMKF